MNKKNLLSKIASVATELDYAGLTKEAKQIDLILVKLAGMPDKPEFAYSRGIQNDEEIQRMSNPEKVRLYIAIQRHIDKLNYLIRQSKSSYENSSYTMQLKAQIEAYEEKIKEYTLIAPGNANLVSSLRYYEQQLAEAKSNLEREKNNIKELEDERDAYEDFARRVNKNGIYDPEEDYTAGGHRLKKRNIFDKILRREPEIDQNF